MTRASLSALAAVLWLAARSLAAAAQTADGAPPAVASETETGAMDSAAVVEQLRYDNIPLKKRKALIEDCHARADAVESDVLSGHRRRHRIIVDGQNAGLRQSTGGCNGQHTAAATEIKNASETASSGEAVESLKA